MTTKKIIREVEYRLPAENEQESMWGPSKSAVSTMEIKLKREDTPELSLDEWNARVTQIAAQSISDVFDLKTVVLTDSDGNFFAVRGHDIVSAKATVIDSLDV